jgi:ketosteroid isomerase-like protein
MTQRLTVTPEEAADRLAIRELIDAYAHCADRRDAEGQMALFTEDTRFLVFMDSRDPSPSQTIVGRVNLRPVFENLRRYEATTHFNGQSTIELNGAIATGESYCIAHHVQAGNGRSLMVASLRYLDKLLKENGRWLFSERRLMVDWIETRPLGS